MSRNPLKKKQKKNLGDIYRVLRSPMNELYMGIIKYSPAAGTKYMIEYIGGYTTFTYAALRDTVHIIDAMLLKQEELEKRLSLI